MKKYENCLKCKEMFLNRWKIMEKEIVLEREDGETTFLENDVFHKFFINPELLVGYYIWRCDDDVEYGYSLFLEEYDGWVEDCKEIAKQSREIFEKELVNN